MRGARRAALQLWRFRVALATRRQALREAGLRFHNKVVVVLGGNSGIGLASAKAFAAEGARLVITGRSPETLEEARRAIGGNVLAVQSDISDLGQISVLMERIRAEHGRIDVLFVNAGIGGFSPLEEVSEEYFDRMIGTNLKGPFFAVQKAVPLMRAGGAIVLTSSLGHAKGIPGNSVYAAAKAGLRSLARNLGAELVGRGIRVNCFSPGPIETPLFQRSGIAAEQLPAIRQSIIDMVPMKRFGTVEEAADAVLFLAGDSSTYITGIDLFVDGGCVSF
jgi:NAD(P)-dependent dehydrogenase (short-subunit alcohol dehydrogenase family)